MGNEMGNSNSSTLQEDEHSATEAPEKSLQDAVEADELKGQTDLVPAENKDFHVKLTDLDSDDRSGAGDFEDDHLVSGPTEEEETEIHVPESSNIPMESNEVGAEDGKTQSSSLEDNLSGTNDHQVEKYTFIKTEEAGMTNSTIETSSLIPHTDESLVHWTNPFHDPDSREYVDLKSDKHASDIVDTEPSLQVLLKNGISYNQSETILSDSNPDEENNLDDLIDKEMPTQEQNVSSYENAENIDNIDIGDDGLREITTKSDSPNGVENKWDEEAVTQMSLIGNYSPESQTEADLLVMSLNSHCVENKWDDEVIRPMSLIGNYSPESQTEADLLAISLNPLCVENKWDDEVVTRMSLIGNYSPGSQTEADLQSMSLSSHQEILKYGDKCTISREEAKLVGEESKTEENNHDNNSGLLFNESVKELVIDESNVYQYEKNEKESIDEVSYSATNFESPNEEAICAVQQGCNYSTSTCVPVTEKPVQDLSRYIEATLVTVEETITSANKSVGEKAEMSVFSSGGYETQGVGRRVSTESNPDNLSVHSQMQKSPSFSLDLRIGLRHEESDRTPLLFQDKTADENLSSQVEYSQGLLQCEVTPVEKNVIQTLQKSPSEKSKTQFQQFLKEGEETHTIVQPVTPQKQEKGSSGKKAATNKLCNSTAKEIESTSNRGKERRKPKSSLFGKCMCCASMIN